MPFTISINRTVKITKSLKMHAVRCILIYRKIRFAVVFFALLGIGQNRICGINLRHFSSGKFFVRVFVGVVNPRKFAVGVADFVRA